MPEKDMLKDSEMDRILSNQDEIQPSSGFVSSVMEAVRQEAAAPPPIPFPWKRALPFLAISALALAVVLTIGIFVLVQLSRAPMAVTTPAATSGSILPDGIGGAIGWTALSLIMAFVAVKFSTRLVDGRA